MIMQQSATWEGFFIQINAFYFNKPFQVLLSSVKLFLLEKKGFW